MNKAKKFTLIAALILVGAGMALGFISVAAAGFNIPAMMNTVSYTEKTYDVAAPFENIKIDLGSRDLKFALSQDEKAHFFCYENKNISYNVEARDNTLFITSITSYSLKDILRVDFSCGSNILYLPKNVYENLNVSMGSGDLVIDNEFTFEDVELLTGSGKILLAKVKAEDIGMVCGSGNIKAENIEAQSLSLQAGSGDVRVQDCTIADALKQKTSSGEIGSERVKSRSVEIKSGSGDIKAVDITCEEKFEAESSSGTQILKKVVSGNQFKAKNGSGDIRITECDGQNMELLCGSGNITGTVKSAKKFDVRSSSGDVRVPEDEENGGKCHARTGSGDIKLKISE